MRQFLLAIAIICGLPALASADEAHNVFGTFLTHDGGSHIRITDCGDGSPCGRVVWINPETRGPGQRADTVLDVKGTPILGSTLLKDFTRGGNDWRKGKVYDPENDKMYGARLKRLGDGSLQLKGCLGPFCQTKVWTPVSDTVASNR